MVVALFLGVVAYSVACITKVLVEVGEFSLYTGHLLTGFDGLLTGLKGVFVCHRWDTDSGSGL